MRTKIYCIGAKWAVPIFVLILSSFSNGNGQSDSYWENMPENVRERNAFKRFEWFYRQRALPEDRIPEGAIERARTLEREKELERGTDALDVTWSPIGPTGVVSSFPSQWGTVSGRVRAIAVHPTDPNTVYIGAAAGGIWKTTNGGTSWQDVGFDLASLTFGAISIDPNNPDMVYAGAGESMRFFNTTTYSGQGVYKSTNAGASWTHVTNGFGSTTHFGALKVSPTNSNSVFAALGSAYWHKSSPGNEGLWRSTDAGVTWTRTLNVDDGFDVLPHPTTANLVYGATGGAGSSAGFHRSTNDGASWTKITTGLPSSSTIDRIQIALPTSLPSTVYALIYNSVSGQNSLYKSTDDGLSWSSTGSSFSSSQGWYDLLLGVNPNDVNEVYIGDAELRRSTNGGSTFSYVGGSYWSQSMHVDFHFMVFAPSNPSIRYVACDGGIYRSTNTGSTWVNLNSPLPTLQYYRIGSHPTNQNIITGGAQDNGVYKTTNGGVGTWTLVSTGDGMECFYDYGNPSRVFASTQNGGLIRSTTGGDYGSFSSIKPSTGDSWAWTTPFFIHPTVNTTIYTASRRPWKSTNSGTTWTDLTGSAIASVSITSMAQSPVDTSKLILAASEWSNSPAVMVSSNGGTSWTTVSGNIGGTARYITRVVAHPTDAATVVVVRSGFSAGNKIWRSTNFGTSWTNISGDLPDVPHNDLFIDPLNTSHLYTANDLGVYRSTNSGTSWTRQGNNLPYVPAMDFDYFNSGGVRLLRVATHGRSAYQTVLETPPSTPVLASPANGATNQAITLTLSWNGAAGAVRHRLQVSTSASFSTLIVDDSTLATTSRLVGSLSGATTYYWRVKSENTGGDSPYSSSRSFTTAATVQADVRLFLEGPYNTGTGLMSTGLRTAGILASRFVGVPVPSQAVDSIAVEARASLAVERILAEDKQTFSIESTHIQPAWLLANGTIRAFYDTTKAYVELTTVPDNYFLVVHHRNHLAVASAVSHPLNAASVTAYNFTTAQSQAYGPEPMKLVAAGVYGLYVGDANNDGYVTSTDFNVFNPRFISGASGYEVSDWNLDGFVTSTDFNLFNPNFISARRSSVP